MNDTPTHDGRAVIELSQTDVELLSMGMAGRASLKIGTLVSIDFGTHGIGALPITRFDIAPGGGTAAIILGQGETDPTAQRMHQLRQNNRALREQVQAQADTIQEMSADKEELRQRLAEAEQGSTSPRERAQREADAIRKELKQRLTEAETESSGAHEIVTPTVWRQGHKVKQNVYAGDDPVAQFHDTEDARLVVDAVNAYVAELQGWDKNITVNVHIHKENTE